MATRKPRKRGKRSDEGRPATSAAAIAEAEMPGWSAQAPEEAPAADEGVEKAAATPDATFPSMGELRRKYLGVDEAAGQADEEAAPADDSEVVTMKSGPLEVKVGVSKKGKKVTWRQG